MSAETIHVGQTIIIRDPDSIYQAEGEVEGGSFQGRWHLSCEDYYDRDYTHFGSLRLFNDITLSPGAALPPHAHSNIEIVTYCAAGEFRHGGGKDAGDMNGSRADDDTDAVLRQGWVQHLTAGSGLWHSEANNLEDKPVRFVQMWFLPLSANLEPSRELKRVERPERSDSFLPLVSNDDDAALDIASDARVCSCFLKRGRQVIYPLGTGRGLYLYLLEGGPVLLNGTSMAELAAARVIGGEAVAVRADGDGELLLVDIPLAFDPRCG